jgi:hypothetical protein
MRRPWPLHFDVAALRPTETATAPGRRILNVILAAPEPSRGTAPQALKITAHPRGCEGSRTRLSAPDLTNVALALEVVSQRLSFQA